MKEVFAGIVDYAGLFPPASASMAEAVFSYSTYRRGPDREMLGRFVVSEGRLTELVDAALPAGEGEGWQLALVMAPGVDTLRERLDAAIAIAGRAGMSVAAIEIPISGAGDVAAIAEAVPAEIECFVEVPHHADPEAVAVAASATGVGMKIRTGGVVPEAFPAAETVARFIGAAVHAGVPYKATAGLHHPLRGEYRLTYQPDSPSHRMHGFVNLLAATAAAMRQDDPRRMLVAELPDLGNGAGSIVIGGDGFSAGELLAARRFFRGFGSCSFREPVDELQEAGIT